MHKRRTESTGGIAEKFSIENRAACIELNCYWASYSLRPRTSVIGLLVEMDAV